MIVTLQVLHFRVCGHYHSVFNEFVHLLLDRRKAPVNHFVFLVLCFGRAVELFETFFICCWFEFWLLRLYYLGFLTDLVLNRTFAPIVWLRPIFFLLWLRSLISDLGRFSNFHLRLVQYWFVNFGRNLRVFRCLFSGILSTDTCVSGCHCGPRSFIPATYKLGPWVAWWSRIAAAPWVFQLPLLFAIVSQGLLTDKIGQIFQWCNRSGPL